MEKLEKVENEFTKMIRDIRERKLPGCKTAMGVAVHRRMNLQDRKVNASVMIHMPFISSAPR